jgi:hypothetical protein
VRNFVTNILCNNSPRLTLSQPYRQLFAIRNMLSYASSDSFSALNPTSAGMLHRPPVPRSLRVVVYLSSSPHEVEPPWPLEPTLLDQLPSHAKELQVLDLQVGDRVTWMYLIPWNKN